MPCQGACPLGPFGPSEAAREHAGPGLATAPLGTLALKGKGELAVFRCRGEAAA